ncbi:protein ABIL2-like [Macadamia integrifolia]|uniref:protein ABIL2-like n=1 Tax=Macadamia integrifolia TaxID=60698 RepID=UPI001C528172|nr:protein ABIL2-like [Macadamia integrifolia]XP_042480498.1 protein ABIL2-like [Macadamia integrifolia]
MPAAQSSFLPSQMKIPSSASNSVPQEASNYDELSMKQSLLFSESLKDLKNLRTQLYSAAEYFELSYSNDDQKQMVVDTLKDYAIKALVNTVDHLGSVTFKVNCLLEDKVDEVLGSELRISCIEQRLRTCQAYIDHQGISQQSLVITTPKYHKRYILPAGEVMHSSSHATSKYQGCSLDDEDDWHQFKNAVRTIRETPPSLRKERKGRSPSPSPRPAIQLGTFSFTEKRTVSPSRSSFLLRSGSFASRQTTPLRSRPTTLTSSTSRKRYPSEPRKSVSMRIPADRDAPALVPAPAPAPAPKENEQNPSKSKRLLKALLSRRKSKKDDVLYTYLDEY